MAQTLKFGNGTWANKEGSSLAYSDTNNAFKPLPFSFSRDSIGTRVNKEGLIEVVGKDIPRIDYKDSADGVLLLENSATNLVTYSEDFSQWNSGSTYTTQNYAISPDGTLNASRLLFTSSGQNIYKSTTATGDIVGSLYVKGIENETIQLFVGGAETLFTLSGEWQRIVVEKTSSTNGFININTNGGATARDLLIYGGQVEEGNVSSYIPTSGSTYQRAAETANGSGNSEVFNDSQGVLFANIAANANDGSDREITLSDGTNTNRVVIGYNTSNQIVVAVISGSVQMLNTVTTDILLNKKIVLKYKQNDFALWIDGIKVYTDLIGSTFSENTLNQISFNRPDTNASVYGKIKELAYYDEVLTDLELETLTSYRTWEEMVKELNLNIIHNE